MDLINKHCTPCEGGMPPLGTDEIEKYKSAAPDWLVVENKNILKEFRFKDFEAAMKFVNKVAEIAEAENHHPDIYIFYNKVRLELSTHSIHGLSENDFILAAKIDKISS